MPHPIRIPELLSPAGSLDAVRAAVANGADAVYLGAERFNARDEGAQLTLDEVGTACRIAHARGARIYLTLNTLVKPAELSDALLFLGEAIDRGIDAAIVQDIGIVRLIKKIYPGFEIHGSTQMTVHDVAGAEVMQRLGVERVVLARENTLEDIRAIRSAVPELGLETFIHGALCISYSGQCYMSGMISERSANRGSCAQSCRKDYVLKDADSNEILDSGYLISARDLGAYASIPEIADAGVGCLKIEGRKKKPEYVAVVTRNYRETLSKVAAGGDATLPDDAQQDLVQIFSRGFTPGMYQGRAGREYVTRSHPDNRGMVIGAVIGSERGELIVETTLPVVAGDGLAFEPPRGTDAKTLGFTVEGVRTISIGEITRLAIRTSVYVPTGWTVIRSFDMRLMAGARDSFANVLATPSEVRRALDVRVFGSPGSALKIVFSSGDDTVTARSNVALAKADKRALDAKQLREQFGRLGGTSFVLGNLDLAGLADGLFLPVSELNHVRQTAVEELEQRLQWRRDAAGDERSVHVAREVADVSPREMLPIQVARETKDFTLVAETFDFGDAIAAAAAGATEICFDPFLRHPAPPAARLRDLGSRLLADGVAVRLRLPSIVRPAERKNLAKWLALGLPMSSGHLGLVAELASQGHDVVADYAVNCFNQHAASEIFGMGASRIVLSVELTTDEMLALSKPWQGRGFDAVVYGRPEGMTIEHCVLSAAFNREPTTCRDLCVRDHTNVVLTDPAGYSFSVATDSACRNRLLHSRPLEASEFIPRLWHGGLRNYRMLFNVRGDRVAELVSGYRSLLESLRDDRGAGGVGPRQVVGGAFTRGHFARAV